jgi:hypothetical protein
MKMNPDQDPFLNIEVGGHRITMDCRAGYVRVNCNGATQAQFNPASMGDIKALKAAVNFAAELEGDALKYPKT